jgi:hypothetical protein
MLLVGLWILIAVGLCICGFLCFYAGTLWNEPRASLVRYTLMCVSLIVAYAGLMSFYAIVYDLIVSMFALSKQDPFRHLYKKGYILRSIVAMLGLFSVSVGAVFLL